MVLRPSLACRRPQAVAVGERPLHGSLRALHGGGDSVEGGADLRAQEARRTDDANRDQRGDETILNGRRTRLVLYEMLDEVLHDDTLPSCSKPAPLHGCPPIALARYDFWHNSIGA